MENIKISDIIFWLIIIALAALGTYALFQPL